MVPGIHDFLRRGEFKDVDGRVKPGHDDERGCVACALLGPGMTTVPNSENPART
jgi:hypothetical protein